MQINISGLIFSCILMIIFTGPRVKPVFVRASERMTVAERERKIKQQKKEEAEARKEKEERRREALKLVEETIRSEQRHTQVSYTLDYSWHLVHYGPN